MSPAAEGAPEWDDIDEQAFQIMAGRRPNGYTPPDAAAPGPDRGEAERQGLDAVLRGDLGMWHGEHVTIGSREYWDAALKEQRRALAAAEARAERVGRERDEARAVLRQCEWIVAEPAPSSRWEGEGCCPICHPYQTEVEGTHTADCALAEAIGGPAPQSDPGLTEPAVRRAGSSSADPAAAGPAPEPSDLAAARAAVRRDALEGGT